MAFFDFLTGADEQADAIKQATKKAIAFEKEGRDTAVAGLQPGANYQPIQGRLYDLAGLNGGQAQQNAFGQFQESPEIAFQRQQGEEAAQRGAAAGGHLASGRTLADLSKFGQGLASQSYGDYYNRLRDLYGSALGTAGNIAGIRSGSGSNLANLAMSGGQQYAQARGAQGGVLGDLLSQGAALAAYAYGGGQVGTPGSTGSSYGR